MSSLAVCLFLVRTHTMYRQNGRFQEIPRVNALKPKFQRNMFARHFLCIAALVCAGSGCAPVGRAPSEVEARGGPPVQSHVRPSAVLPAPEMPGAEAASAATSSEEAAETPGGPTTEGVSAFLLSFQDTVDVLVGEGARFQKGVNDPSLQAAYMEEGSDVPLMRFLGRKGLNNLEMNKVEERIAALKKAEAADDFKGSLDRLEGAHVFLKRFYSNIRTLESFEEFKSDMADLLSYRESLDGVASTIQLEYGLLKDRRPGLDYRMTDGIAGLIVRLYAPQDEGSPLPGAGIRKPSPNPSSSNISDEERASAPSVAPRSCCRYCSTGQACGDSCISRRYTCHKAPGCACDA